MRVFFVPFQRPPGRRPCARAPPARTLYGERVDDHVQVFVSPGDVAASLGVSGSTFRRISQDYESVFQELPRDANNRRLWTLEAAQRVQAAHSGVKEGRADSTRAALEALRDGRDLPIRADLPPAPDAGHALAELRDQLDRQGEGITRMLQALDARDGEIADALRVLGAAQVAQIKALDQLRADLAARPAPAPVSVRPRGLLARLLRALLE